MKDFPMFDNIEYTEDIENEKMDSFNDERA